jgi:dTDP-4-amino-4,6-dideoxygalactose transaminase
MVQTIVRVPYTDFPEQFRQSREETLALVERIFSKGAFILGEEVEAFEKDFARLCGSTEAIGVANGTDALTLVLKALNIGAGHDVITVPNSFVATAGGIIQAGARPVFVDVRDDLNMDPARLEAAITPRTRAIMPVHLAGRCCDMDFILDIARRHKLPVIEDSAQAVGARYKGRTAGSFGVAACFSFHPLKNLNAAGDAGIITTSDASLAERLRRLRNHGLKSRDEVSEWGVNSRLDALQAALLRHRLGRLDAVVATRRRLADRYRAGLRSLAVPIETKDEFHVYHLFVIQTDRRNELQAHLAANGIDTKIHYPIPIHLQPAARELGYAAGSFPVTERQASRILSLPIHQHLSEAQVDRVCEQVAAFLSEARR